MLVITTCKDDCFVIGFLLFVKKNKKKGIEVSEVPRLLSSPRCDALQNHLTVRLLANKNIVTLLTMLLLGGNEILQCLFMFLVQVLWQICRW